MIEKHCGRIAWLVVEFCHKILAISETQAPEYSRGLMLGSFAKPTAFVPWGSFTAISHPTSQQADRSLQKENYPKIPYQWLLWQTTHIPQLCPTWFPVSANLSSHMIRRNLKVRSSLYGLEVTWQSLSPLSLCAPYTVQRDRERAEQWWHELVTIIQLFISLSLSNAILQVLLETSTKGGRCP